VVEHKIYIILGSNIGDKKGYIDKACNAISQFVGRIDLYSSYYQTSPWGFESDDEFLNRAICVKSSLSPDEVMNVLLEIESNLGRVRDINAKGYQSRTIDLDILLIDDLIIESKLLVVPHVKLHERKFVLVPLAEIAGEYIHPIKKIRINDLLSICEDKEIVTKVF
jgi:2-amino-4-hydroxy-6-hydroxymethyldihydropteridine diphosphokinase